MKVVCMNNKSATAGIDVSGMLTEGKVYEMIRVDEGQCLIDCDNLGTRCYFYRDRFKLLDDIREEKLNKLGI